MKIFDIAKFNRLKKGNSYECRLEDGTVISQMVSIYNNQIMSYDEWIRPPNSHYKYINIFYPNGNLLISRIDFYSISIGISETYDINGNILETKNYDAPYLFTIKDLAEKMKKEYNIDIYDIQSRFSMVRKDDNKKMGIPYYEISFPYKGKQGNIRQILIDGRTGEELYVIDKYHRDTSIEGLLKSYYKKRDLMEKK